MREASCGLTGSHLQYLDSLLNSKLRQFDLMNLPLHRGQFTLESCSLRLQTDLHRAFLDRDHRATLQVFLLCSAFLSPSTAGEPRLQLVTEGGQTISLAPSTRPIRPSHLDHPAPRSATAS